MLVEIFLLAHFPLLLPLMERQEAIQGVFMEIMGMVMVMAITIVFLVLKMLLGNQKKVPLFQHPILTLRNSNRASTQ